MTSTFSWIDGNEEEVEKQDYCHNCKGLVNLKAKKVLIINSNNEYQYIDGYICKICSTIILLQDNIKDKERVR